ncbi:MAG TPA: hypothetical protein VJ044_05925 [Candidatus Hodarchaeales archaeon]|uniref:Uncharacterized protein n=2 Tax=Candidatus Chisholmiibacteriota TaxID=1817900 RepID=A0A1G1VMD7_9BACT|nr:MAG: hypothetical protein A2785_03010 [Candidatus Chisholmbacteria bacterium RIFCSPHIGHO2_01_FULL_49_18]HKZ40480.1 hypothetical protein [Candidatus Hodarchaeales archaeon]
MTNSEGSIITGDSSPDELLAVDDVFMHALRLIGEFRDILDKDLSFLLSAENFGEVKLFKDIAPNVPFHLFRMHRTQYILSYEELDSRRTLEISKDFGREAERREEERIKLSYVDPADENFPVEILWTRFDTDKGREEHRNTRTAVEGVKGFLEGLRKASQIPDL